MDILLDFGFQQGADDQMTLVMDGVMGTARLGHGGDDGIRTPRYAEEQQSIAMRQTRALADDLICKVVSDENNLGLINLTKRYEELNH